ncbi:type IV pilin [Photobacterium phosphoreum]|uniref:GspH/FimT family pseudopilin n=1 Tax=Photobacterium phosphoreum TaxID=659 RepID=UPI000D1587ED|nr:GspH/FimT family pseudopilin [Photobacterium phosphoreum]MCD9521158.1 prepilin-type N-terminal cleavage/methylation domain-containing protein [Photobacterium phosphoreum]PSW29605.1 type IV pilin [Photobacterium phosphoreum]
MAREIITHFHYIHHNGDSQRGFTLLELVFTVVIMGILIAMAAPSFNGLIESNKVKRLATEIEWLLVQAKSEAVMRGKNVYVNAPLVSSTRINSDWCIFTSTYKNKKRCADSDPRHLSSIDSANFSGVTFKRSSTLKKFSFEPIYGKPNANGNYSYRIGDYKLKTVLYSITGRIYTCLEVGSKKLSNYEKC